MTILWLVLDSKFALRKYFDYSHTLSDFSLNINFSIWLQLTLKPSWFIKVYNVWLFLTIADYFWLFLTFMRKFLTQNLSLAEVIFWILGGESLDRKWKYPRAAYRIPADIKLSDDGSDVRKRQRRNTQTLESWHPCITTVQAPTYFFALSNSLVCRARRIKALPNTDKTYQNQNCNNLCFW